MDAVPGIAAKRKVEPAKPSGMIASAGAPGVEQQVLTGDADVELARPDVDRDVARAQEEELGVVLGVEQDELAGVAALAVPGLDEHLTGGLGERALVRNGDAEHAVPVCGEGADEVGYRCR